MSIHLLLAAAAAVAAQGQAADPLAPLPTQPAPASRSWCEVPNAQPGVARSEPATTHTVVTPPPQQPVTVTIAPPLPHRRSHVVAVSVPRNWAEVFAAIRGSRWAEAQAGICFAPAEHSDPGRQGGALHRKGFAGRFARPDPVAARRSAGPAAGGASWREWRLPAARRRTPQYVAEAANHLARQFAQPLQGQGRLGRAGRRPASLAARSADQGGRCDQRRAAADADRRPTFPTKRGRKPGSASPGPISRWAAMPMRAGLPTPIGRARPATGRASRLGSPASRPGASTIATPRRAAFREVGSRAQQRELAAAGYYWAARAEQACRRPRSVAPLLKAAAGSPESFYGLLARETLGIDKSLPPDVHNGIGRIEGAAERPPRRRAGQHRPALARRGNAQASGADRPSVQDHHALIEVAKKLDLPSAPILARA